MKLPFFHSRRHRQISFVFEATQACNYNCLHCYNVWKGPVAYPVGQLPTAATLAMLDKMIDQTHASLVTLSGGEPLLRQDIFQIVDHLVAGGMAINFLTNGSLLEDAAIARLAPGKISIFELPLLSVERAIHDELSGQSGAFDGVTRAIANLKAAGQRVVCVFVATNLNLHSWRQTAELAIALGADGIMFNRYNPGGQGGAVVQRLQAAPEALREALDIAQELVERYHIGINCSIPMPPCLFDHSRWPRLGFGFCAAGTANAYYTLDAVGNIRPCNHSRTILGNIHDSRFADLAGSQAMKEFQSAHPAFCAGCKMELTCLGGCKAAAEACRGSIRQADPFLEVFGARGRRPS